MVKLQRMKIHKTRAKLPLFMLSLVAFVLFFAVCTYQQGTNAKASADSPVDASTDGDSHFVTIYNNGERTIVRSDASTVRELLERAEINYSDTDKIEPGLDDTIDEDDYYVNIYRSRELVVIDGQKETIINTASTDPEAIVKDAGVKLLAADQVKLISYDKFLETGMRTAYQIVRAKTVNLDFNGQHAAIRTQAKTVADFLAEQNIDTNPEVNWVSLSGETRIAEGLQLSVYFQGEQVVTYEEDIPFSEKITQDFSLDYGARNVTQAGVPGKKSVVYNIEMHDGQIISKEFISEVVTAEPVEQLVTVGMKLSLPAGSHEDWMAAAGISAADYGYVNFIISHESGWRTTASNVRYYGLYQTSLGRLQSDCPNWQNDPVCQLRSATSYANGRYGGWASAYAAWQRQHWW